MQSSFDEILEKALGRKLDKSNIGDATASVDLNAKGLSLTGTFKLRGTEAFGDTVAEDAFEAASTRVDDIINNVIMGQGFFDRKDKVVKFGKKSKVKVPTTVYGLRDKQGRIMSGLQLSQVLNSTLDRYIQQLMGTKSRLNNRTGRLASSAQVTGIRFQEKVAAQRKNRVSVFFTYMMAPYSVFEKGGQQYKPGRSPSKLIQEALRLALKDSLSKTSFNNNMFDRVYKGRRF